MPFHFGEAVVDLLEKVRHLGALVVPLGVGEELKLGLVGEVLADLGDGEDNLLHGSVVTNHLNLSRMTIVKSTQNKSFQKTTNKFFLMK